MPRVLSILEAWIFLVKMSLENALQRNVVLRFFIKAKSINVSLCRQRCQPEHVPRRGDTTIVRPL